jgi:hypothetical protein
VKRQSAIFLEFLQDSLPIWDLFTVTEAGTWPASTSCFTDVSWKYRQQTDCMAESIAFWSINHLYFKSLSACKYLKYVEVRIWQCPDDNLMIYIPICWWSTLRAILEGFFTIYDFIVQNLQSLLSSVHCVHTGFSHLSSLRLWWKQQVMNDVTWEDMEGIYDKYKLG